MPYCDDRKIIFLHIPKTGGTAIGKMFGITKFQDPNPATIPTPQHMTCNRLRECLGDEKYTNYYKFTFVRNPWARILSSYFWRQTLKKKRQILPFEDFVENIKEVVKTRVFYQQEFGDHFIPQVEFTRDADEVLRFEQFEAGIKTVSEKLGVVIKTIPPKPSKHYDNYWEFYNERSQSVIADVYREEIEEFGYVFNDYGDESVKLTG